MNAWGLRVSRRRDGSHHHELDSVSRCYGSGAGIVIRTSRRLSPDSSGRPGMGMPWGEGGGTPSRRPRILASIVGARSLSTFALRSELGGKCAREVADRLPGLLSVGLRHAQQHEAPDGRASEQAVLNPGEVCRERVS